MNKEEIIKALRDMAKYPTVTLPRDCEALKAAADLLSQPKRTWQGLTQQDIDIAFDDTQEGGGFDDFARAIETTLKRKNT